MEEARGAVSLIWAQRDFLALDANLTVSSVHGQIERLNVPRRRESNGRRQAKLKLSGKKLRDMLVTLVHRVPRLPNV